jgi:hypothetical protein
LECNTTCINGLYERYAAYSELFWLNYRRCSVFVLIIVMQTIILELRVNELPNSRYEYRYSVHLHMYFNIMEISYLLIVDIVIFSFLRSVQTDDETLTPSLTLNGQLIWGEFPICKKSNLNLEIFDHLYLTPRLTAT